MLTTAMPTQGLNHSSETRVARESPQEELQPGSCGVAGTVEGMPTILGIVHNLLPWNDSTHVSHASTFEFKFGAYRYRYGANKDWVSRLNEIFNSIDLVISNAHGSPQLG